MHPHEAVQMGGRIDLISTKPGTEFAWSYIASFEQTQSNLCYIHQFTSDANTRGWPVYKDLRKLMQGNSFQIL